MKRILGLNVLFWYVLAGCGSPTQAVATPTMTPIIPRPVETEATCKPPSEVPHPFIRDEWILPEWRLWDGSRIGFETEEGLRYFFDVKDGEVIRYFQSGQPDSPVEETVRVDVSDEVPTAINMEALNTLDNTIYVWGVLFVHDCPAGGDVLIYPLLTEGVRQIEVPGN